jgi:vacuole morphology and inheritance protein 14
LLNRVKKRKLAALEIEKMVRDFVALKDYPKITILIECLVQDFSYSTQTHSRNGGLIALAATANTLGTLKNPLKSNRSSHFSCLYRQ